MKYLLSNLDWNLVGYIENKWKTTNVLETGNTTIPEIGPIKVNVPGSVHTALREAGIIKDWNSDLNFLDCEWVEHREWVYYSTFDLNIKPNKRYVLNFDGLDYSGTVILNDQKILNFKGTHLSYQVDIEDILKEKDNFIKIVFETPPKTTGQVGYTSTEKTLKPRFNYTWDWCPRLVNIGVWKDVFIEEWENCLLTDFYPKARIEDKKGVIDFSLTFRSQKEQKLNLLCKVTLQNKEVLCREISVILRNSQQSCAYFSVDIDEIELWYPNRLGDQPLYEVTLIHLGEECAKKRIGFKSGYCEQRPNAQNEEPSYLFNINGQNVFIRGVNWVPISPFYGTVDKNEYERQLKLFKEMNINLIRVWGGGILESEVFYNLCDEYGIMVWQEFPQSSSGIDNAPCEDYDFIENLNIVAKEFILRRRHHASHLIWCGGNELLAHGFVPVSDQTSNNLKTLREIVSLFDSSKIFLPASPFGHTFLFDENKMGKNYDVHGPWDYLGAENHYKSFNKDDSLFKSEVGTAAPASLRVLGKYALQNKIYPPNKNNLFWTNRGNWWIRQDEVSALFKDFYEEDCIEELFVAWRYIQFESLRYSSQSMRRKFPRCGGYIIWMANEPFPNNSNTSLLDFNGNTKPAYYAVQSSFDNVCLSLEYDKINYSQDERFVARVFLQSDFEYYNKEIKATVLDKSGQIIIQRTLYEIENSVGGYFGDIEFVIQQTASPCFFVELSCEDINTKPQLYAFTVGGSRPFEAFYSLGKAVLETKIDRDFAIVKNTSDIVAPFVFVMGFNHLGKMINSNENNFFIKPNEKIICHFKETIVEIVMEGFNI